MINSRSNIIDLIRKFQIQNLATTEKHNTLKKKNSLLLMTGIYDKHNESNLVANDVEHIYSFS